MFPAIRLKASVCRGVSRRRTAAHIVAAAKPILYDMPVSNNGARCRFVLYKKRLSDQYSIEPPSNIGGLKSEQYLKLNPQGKMPLLVMEGGRELLPESEVIVQYLLDKHRDIGPSLLASTPELRAKAALVSRIHDTYIVPIQACMYRAMPSVEQRAKDLAQLAFQLDVLEGTIAGPYATGPEITSADGTIFPTMVFCDFILPKYFGWTGLWSTRPKLAAWWTAIQSDPEAAQVIEEVRGGLEGWAAADRWQAQGILDHVATPGYMWSY